MAIPDKAITRNEQYLAAMAGQSGTLPDEPITRKEFYLAKAAGQAVETPEPITREEMYLDVIAEGGGGGGGGGDISVVPLTATENKTYTATAGKAYSPVTVNVPIPTPSLIAKTVTENGTYAAADDGADGYSSVTVNVPGSGEWSSEGVASLSEPFGDIVLTGTTIGAYALFQRPITSLRGDNVTTTAVYGLANANKLKRVTLPNLINVANQFMTGCTSLENIYADSLPNVDYLGQQSIRGCAALSVVVLPCIKIMSAWQCLTNNGMHTLDAGATNACSIGSDALQGNNNLNKIVLRCTSVASLGGKNAFNGTPFADGGSGGTLYVPQSLIPDYQNATNWSTILGYTNNQIKAIEGSIYETQYADGTPIS